MDASRSFWDFSSVLRICISTLTLRVLPGAVPGVDGDGVKSPRTLSVSSWSNKS